MKIKKKILLDFLKKTSMGGSTQIDEAILKFGNEGLKIDANSKNTMARAMGWLKTSAFKEYESIGNLGLNQFGDFIKVVERFGDEISLKKEGNLLGIKGEGKSVNIELIDESFLSEDTGTPNLEWEETFVISSTKLKDIFKDVTMNKDAELIITTEDKKVIFSNTGKWKFTNEHTAPTCKGGVEVKYGEPFLDAVSNFTDILEISISSDYPCKVMEKTEVSIISIIVAPRVASEE